MRTSNGISLEVAKAERKLSRFTRLFTCAVSMWVGLGSAVLICQLPAGCGTPTQQRITQNTLYTLERTALAAYDGYVDLVIAGRVKTNSVPAISEAFNDFQTAMQAAIALAQWNTNAPATAELLAKAGALTEAITQAKGR